jgi:hypothetical protein
MLNRDDPNGTKKQVTFTGSLIKGSVRYSTDNNLTLITRLDYKFTRPDGARGMLLLQDITYRFGNIPLSVWFRYCIFKTDDWNSRLYTYENDLLFCFSIPALSGEGIRSYIMVEWNPTKFIDFRVKYGLTEIHKENYANSKTQELKVQARIWF